VDFDDTRDDLRNLSVSKIEKAMLCPRAFKFQYIDRIPQVSSGRFLSGNAVHKVLEHALRDKARTGKLIDWKTLDDMFVPAWEAEVAEEEAKEDFLGWDWKADDPAETVQADCRQLVRVAYDEVLPHVKPWMLA
jgi:hypothetical protein